MSARAPFHPPMRPVLRPVLRGVFLLLVAAWAAEGSVRPAWASGALVPAGKEPGTRCEIESVRIAAQIQGRAATLRIEQVVHNTSKAPARVEYLLPLPAGAEVKKLRLHDGPQSLAGRLLTGDDARAHLIAMLKRRKDPVLVAHLGARLFHVPGLVIPAGGRKTLILTYEQTLRGNAGLSELVVPLAASRAGIAKVEAKLDVQSPAGLGPVYSPTHDIQVIHRGAERAWVAYEGAQPAGGKDLALYWSHTRLPVGATLLSHWPKTESQGYFLLLAEPRHGESRNAARRPKNISFVVDVSGSMRGEKLEGVRAALLRVIRSLAVGDRFNVVAYNSEVSALWSRPKAVSPDALKQALYFVNQLKAARGTNIEGALRAALGPPRTDLIPSVILFLTDGRPTVGETDPERLLKKIGAANPKRHTRVFVLGVGVDVNPVLLDRLALENGGMPVYVRKSGSIAGAVTNLYAKIRQPVLTNVTFAAPAMRVTDALPAELPDLFHGSEVVVAGRYSVGGPMEIALAGRAGTVEYDFHFTRTVARRGEGLADNFPARLWATRRIAERIDAIRLHANRKVDYADEITRLSTQFGVLTEYTAFLAGERGVSHRAAGANAERTRRNIVALTRRDFGGTGLAQSKAQSERRSAYRMAPAAGAWFSTPDDRDVHRVSLTGVRQVANRTFYFRGAYHGWVDVAADVAKVPDEVVVRWSPAFFKLLESTSVAENRRLGQAGPLLLEVRGRILRIVDPA